MEIVQSSDVNDRLPAYWLLKQSIVLGQKSGLFTGISPVTIDTALSAEPAGLDYLGNLVVSDSSVPAVLMLQRDDTTMDTQRAYLSAAQQRGLRQPDTGYDASRYNEEIAPGRNTPRGLSFSYPVTNQSGDHFSMLPTAVTVSPRLADPIQKIAVMVHEIGHQLHDANRVVVGTSENVLASDSDNALAEKLAFGDSYQIVGNHLGPAFQTHLPRIVEQIQIDRRVTSPEATALTALQLAKRNRDLQGVSQAVVVKVLQTIYESPDNMVVPEEVTGYKTTGIIPILSIVNSRKRDAL